MYVYIYIYISIFGFNHHAWVCLRPQKRSRQKILEDVLHCFSFNRFLAQLHPPNDTILVLYLAWPYLILPELSWLYKTTFRNLCFWGSEGRGARRKGPGARAARLALETPRVIDFTMVFLIMCSMVVVVFVMILFRFSLGKSLSCFEWRIDIFRVQWLRFSFRPWYLYKKVTCRNTRSIAGHFFEE